MAGNGKGAVYMMNGNLAYQAQQREELIGGKFIAMSPATPRHNFIAGNIFNLFKNYLKGKPCVPFHDGTEVRLGKQDRFIPDFMVVCDRDKIKSQYIQGNPDLVVEVLSPSTAKNDRWYKKNAYEANGVPEYWLVDPAGKSIEVYLLADGQYRLENIYYFYTEEEIAEMDEEEKAALVTSFHCHLYDDLDISLADIFEDLF